MIRRNDPLLAVISALLWSMAPAAWADQPIFRTSLCTDGAADVVIAGQVLMSGDVTTCVATGSITVGPNVTCEAGSDTLLQAPVITLLDDVEAHEGSIVTLRSFSTVPVR